MSFLSGIFSSMFGSGKQGDSFGQNYMRGRFGIEGATGAGGELGKASAQSYASNQKAAQSWLGLGDWGGGGGGIGSGGKFLGSLYKPGETTPKAKEDIATTASLGGTGVSVNPLAVAWSSMMQRAVPSSALSQFGMEAPATTSVHQRIAQRYPSWASIIAG